MKKTLLSRMVFIITLLTVPMSAFGYRYFYRAGPYPYFNEPRFERDHLGTFEAYVMGGSTTKGRNGSHNKTNVLNTYGTTNLWQLGVGVPNLNLVNPIDALLITLRNQVPLADTATYGQLQYSGTFKYVGADFRLLQNLTRGFFLQWNIPVQRLQISSISFVDLTNYATVGAGQSAALLAVLGNINAILAQFGLSGSTQNYSKTGVGDMQVYGGWTHNNETNTYFDCLDFIDTTLKIGVSIPSASKINTTQVFSIPAGYNGHPGIMLEAAAAFGFLKWLTWSIYANGLLFFSEPMNMRIQTSTTQNGWFVLAQDAVKENMGNLWDIGMYFKADHCISGLSLMLGYTYVAQGTTTVTPYNTALFTAAAANNYERLKKWSMHTLHVSADYDFSKTTRWFNPKVGIFYDCPIAGKRIFKTNVSGALIGANMLWEF